MRRLLLHPMSFALVALGAAACGGSDPAAPLPPPGRALTVALRDSAVAGEMTWVQVTRTSVDTAGIVYASSDTTVATVDSTGRLFLAKPGVATITAKIGTVTGQYSLTAATRPDSFRVAFRFSYTPSTAERQVFARAAARWHRVLRQSSAWTVDLPGGACLPGTVAGAITQQGLVVYVDRFADSTVAPSVTGQAGACLVDAQGRTQVGVISLRQSFMASVDTMSAAHRFALENTVVHELGQTLGLAGLTVYGVPRPELDTTRAGDARWTGTHALAAYAGAGGTLSGVPLSADLSFWRDSVSGTAGDVMLPTVTTALRIGALTLGGLVDRSYTAVESRVEPVPAASMVAAASRYSAVTARTAPWTGRLWVSNQRMVRPLH